MNHQQKAKHAQIQKLNEHAQKFMEVLTQPEAFDQMYDQLQSSIGGTIKLTDENLKIVGMLVTIGHILVKSEIAKSNNQESI